VSGSHQRRAKFFPYAHILHTPDPSRSFPPPSLSEKTTPQAFLPSWPCLTSRTHTISFFSASHKVTVIVMRVLLPLILPDDLGILQARFFPVVLGCPVPLNLPPTRLTTSRANGSHLSTPSPTAGAETDFPDLGSTFGIVASCLIPRLGSGAR